MPVPIRFYTVESLAPASKRAWTPEGFLLCQQVPIARVGTLLYGRGEIPVTANVDGLIRIVRDPDEVFHPNAILSFAGKPVTDEHPPSKVTPDNWKQHSIGVVLHPHQGDGRAENNDLLYADLLIQDREAIKDVLEGKREVSAGYDAEYEQLKPGEGKQHNIIGNHVALVAKGRCGPICSIGDSVMAKTKLSPKQRRMQSFRDSIMTAFQTGDEEGLVDELDKVDEMLGSTAEGTPSEAGAIGFNKSGGGSAASSDEMGGTHVHIHTGGAMDEPPKGSPAAAATGAPPSAPPGAAAPGGDPSGGAGGGGGGITLEQLAARIDQLEQAIAILAQGEGGEGGEEEGPDENSPGMSGSPPDDDSKKPPTGDRRRATGDSASLVVAFQEVMSRAELLVPGVRRPTFDAARPVKVTMQHMCDFRRQTIDTALAHGGESRDAVMAIAGQPKNPNQYVKAMSCDALTYLFNGATEMMRTQGLRGNDGRPAANGLHHGGGGQSVLSVTDTVANINKLNRERYNIQGR
jgi:hypothetical protein